MLFKKKCFFFFYTLDYEEYKTILIYTIFILYHPSFHFNFFYFSFFYISLNNKIKYLRIHDIKKHNNIIVYILILLLTCIVFYNFLQIILML